MPPAIRPAGDDPGEDHPDRARTRAAPCPVGVARRPATPSPHRTRPRAAGTLNATCRRIGRGADRVRRAGHDGGGDGRQPAPGRVRGHGVEPDARPRRRPGRARRPRGRDAGRGARRPRTSSWCCVSDTPDVEAVLFGDDGVAEGLARGRPRHRLLHDLARRHRDVRRSASREQGIGFVDAPVSGGSEGAQNATLTIFVGGEPEAIERARPVLEAMGKTITHFGPPGSGQAVKAVNQVMHRGRLPRRSRRASSWRCKAGLDPEAVAAALGGGVARQLDPREPERADDRQRLPARVPDVAPPQGPRHRARDGARASGSRCRSPALRARSSRRGWSPGAAATRTCRTSRARSAPLSGLEG